MSRGEVGLWNNGVFARMGGVGAKERRLLGAASEGGRLNPLGRAG